jgi:hypothetical protein
VLQAVHERGPIEKYLNVKEKVNFINLINKILHSRSQWKHHVLQMEARRIPKKILT